MKRSPLKRKTPLKRRESQLQRTPIRRKAESEKTERKQQDRKWFEESKLVVAARSGGQCEYRWLHANGVDRVRCLHEATEFHHYFRQAQGHNHDPEFLFHFCRFHHSEVHDNVNLARELGYLSPAKRGDL